VYLVVTVLSINKMVPLDKAELTVCIVTGLFFLGAVATGGILSAAKNLPAVVQTMHKVLSLLTLLSTAGTFFLLFRRS
jgi:heme A synthase